MENWMLYFILAGTCSFLLLLAKIFGHKLFKTQKGNGRNVVQNEEEQPAPRRIAVVRNRRVPLRQQRRDEHEDDENRDEPTSDVSHEQTLLNDPKLGTKKRAKLEAKIEKKAQREAEERIREEKKKKEEQEIEERKKKEKEEEEKEKIKEELEKKLIEEARKTEEEAYLKLKESFIVEEEGCDVLDKDEEENLLEEFVQFIKAQKVVQFEELATKFSLKVPEAIDRLVSLVETGRVTGVMDDRGKFVYISEEEMNKFAKFIKQRGRVSIVELVENSTQIINLTPESCQ